MVTVKFIEPFETAAQVVLEAEALSKILQQPSFVTPEQLSSVKFVQTSGASGLILALLSLQSPLHVVNPSPSASKPSSTEPSQLSSAVLQTSVAFGRIAALLSLQSPPHDVKPSLSASKPSSTEPSQSSSAALQVSAAFGRTAALLSLQSPPHDV